MRPKLTKKKTEPAWRGPQSSEHGLTQSLISDYLVCPERFRIKVIEGWKSQDKFNHSIEYGNIFHEMIEAKDSGRHPIVALKNYCGRLLQKYPNDQTQINKWYLTAKCQFPVYEQYWLREDKDNKKKSIFQEKEFKIPYTLPSGKCVYLRGKWDGLSLEKDGLWLNENKIKGNIDEQKIQRQLAFDLQTMVYTISVKQLQKELSSNKRLQKEFGKKAAQVLDNEFKGVKYNIIRRPWSMGKGNIKPRQAKILKTKPNVPAETQEQFYNRFRDDYLLEDPDYWFMRWDLSISDRDISTFQKTCLHPILEQICIWYAYQTCKDFDVIDMSFLNYRLPYGVYNTILEGRETDLDYYMLTGRTSGLERVTDLYPELSSENTCYT